jgi:DNA ligase (NAD+)
LQERWVEVQHLLGLGFQLERTPLAAEQQAIQSPIAGLKIVFTGSMQQGGRNDMKKQALVLGARVQSAVSAKTDLLVVGEKAGSKLEKAQELGVRVMSEAEYLQFLAG